MVSLTAAPEDAPSRPRWRDALRLVASIARAQPLPVLAMVALVLVANLRVGVYVAVQGGLADAFLENDGRKAMTWALVFVAAAVVEELYWVLKPWLFAFIRDPAVHRFQKRVMERAAAAPLVAFEHGPFYARLQRAGDNLGDRFSAMLMSLIDSLQVLTMGASIVAAVWLVSPWCAVVVIVAALPALLVQWRVASAVQESQRRTATQRHFLGRLVEIVRDRNAAVELRVFGNGPMLADRFLHTRAAMDGDQIAAETTRMRAGILSETIRGFAIAVAVAIALWTITDRQLSIGTWVMATAGIQWLSGFMGWGTQALRDAREQVAYAGDLFDFEELADKYIAAEARNRHAHPPGTMAVPEAGGIRIALEGVSFAYPGGDRAVVRDVSLAIPPGQTVAIVGENGAGKSTLVRLLTGLYLPDAGTARLDGIDTRSDGMAALTPRIGAVFQDFVAYQLPVRDNIGFGAVGREPSDAGLARAAGQADLRELVGSLPDGYDTWLGRQFGERDLSGGQWQRIALARAFHREAGLVILDEPTAALDAKAEQALFERFAELVQDRTAIMISHRLGSARFADRILVMADGAIVEDGHHDDLMAANGAYARMFAAQAAWYRDGDANAADGAHDALAHERVP